MNIAIIGMGNMGKALVGGIKKAYGDDIRVVGWDKSSIVLDEVKGMMEIIPPDDWKASGFVPDAVIIAVKPGDVCGVLDDVVNPAYRAQSVNTLTVSIAAGVSISSIKKILGDGARVCRVMPNTPAMIGEGVSAYALSDNCGDGDKGIVEKIFRACGQVINVPENLMDAVTGLSGSGPAFVYSFIEALAEGGVSAGLPYKTALDAAVQTVIGAARMITETSEHPSVLRSRVMSPGGTTVKGLEALERGAFKSSVINAVTAAAERSKILGR